MRRGITISVKIWITCIVLVLIIITGSLLTGYFFRNIRHLDENISGIYIPSVNYLTSLEITLHYFDNPASFQSAPDTFLFRTVHKKFEQLKQIEIPSVTRDLNKISNRWPAGEQQVYYHLSSLVSDSLLNLYETLLSSGTDNLSQSIPSRRETIEKTYQVTEAITREIVSLRNKIQGMTSEAIDGINSNHASMLTCLIITGILLSLTLIIAILIIIRTLLSPLNQFRLILQEMARGELPQEPFTGKSDEISQIALALNNLTGRLKALSKFSEEIGIGNYESDFQPLSENDTLGNSLIRMRENLKNAAVEELKRKVEDERRNWANQGIARFSEILREHTHDTDKLNEAVIRNMVGYTNARVGALFLLNKDTKDNFLELSAAYAYDRMKYLRKDILPGEGLVGRCFQEGETIYLTDVPEDYIKIRSGLGEASPTSILIVPLKLHGDILGVVELASFETFEPYKIDFVERICTSIASTIAAIRTGSKRKTRSGKGTVQPTGTTPEEQQETQPPEVNETTLPPGTEKSEEIRKKLEEMLKKKRS